MRKSRNFWADTKIGTRFFIQPAGWARFIGKYRGYRRGKVRIEPVGWDRTILIPARHIKGRA